MDKDMPSAGSEQFDELTTLREMERALRAFKQGYFAPIHANNPNLFHPGTVRMMEAVMPLLDHLDEGREAQQVKPAA